MTAIKERRRRSTIVALAAAVVGLGAAGGLGFTGARSLADSTAGEEADSVGATIPTQRLPLTATALVGVVDDTERLTSAAVWVLEPDGVGGSVVTLAATADTGSGTLDVLAPLAGVFAVEGPEAFREGAERLTGLSFDVIELVDEQRFARLVSPLGDTPVAFPFEFTDESSGESWGPGEEVLSAPAIARALAATDDSAADWALEPGRSAIWSAVADRVGAGIGSVPSFESDRDVPLPTSLDEFAERLFGAAVQVQSLGFTPIDAERVGAELDDRYRGTIGQIDAVVAHDRAEMVILLGAIAPSRLGAPLDAPVFRVVSPFSDDELAAAGVDRVDVLKTAVDRLFFAQANIVSVADVAGAGTPDITRLEVVDPMVIEPVTETYSPLFGEIEVVPAQSEVEGVDVVVTLGRSFLEQARGDSVADVAGSGTNADDG